MTYYESAENLRISRARALAELRKHGVCGDNELAEFFADVECDESGTYDAQAVLAWLGY